MKLKSFQIHHYGPLAETPRIHLDTFNLFWGHNEDGKTLTLEALVTLLLGKTVRRLNRAFARVDKLPVGYVEVELGNDTVRLEGKQSLAELLNLPPDLFLNLFVVRNSDLLIIEDHRFYGSITEQLTHSRLSRIERLKELALQRAQLTSKGEQLRNTTDNRKLRERFQQAEALIQRIQQLEATAEAEQWPELTRRIADIRQRLAHLESAIEQQELAEKRQMLEQGEHLLAEWQTVSRELAALAAITPEVTQQWQALETRIQQLETNITELRQEINKNETALRHEHQKLKKLQIEVERQRQIWEQLQQEFLPTEKQFEDLQETVAARQSWRTILHLLLGGTLLGNLISLYFTLMSPNSRAFIFFLVTLFIFLAEVVAYVMLIVRPTEQLKRLGRRLIHQALQLGLSGEDEKSVILNVQQFKNQFQDKEDILNGVKGKINIIENYLKRNRSNHQQKQEELHQERARLAQLQRELDVASLLELNQRLKEKTALAQRKAELAARLQQLLGTSEATEAAWKAALNQLEPYRQQATDTIYDAQQLTALRQEKTKLETELDTLNHTLQEVRSQLQDVEREARRILVDADPPPVCRSVFDLPAIRKQLQAFHQSVQQQMWLGQQLHSILTEALKEEQARISDLFGKNSTVSHYFREMTQDLYTAVLYDANKKQLKVVQRGNRILTPQQLSGGTFDQLYFAIRIALAERVLQGEPGFLMLDDPFIKADPQRLSLLVELLFTLCERGWQILYFSAKEEILNALKPALQSGQVKRIELPQPFYKANRT